MKTRTVGLLGTPSNESLAGPRDKDCPFLAIGYKTKDRAQVESFLGAIVALPLQAIDSHTAT